jgi:hypothetical protein
MGNDATHPVGSKATRFKVGDRVKHKHWGDGTVIKVKEIWAGLGTVGVYTIDYGTDPGIRVSLEENLELIQPETQEPVPGRFYRTKGGSKMQYVGKAGDIWVYCDTAYVQKSLVKYDEPYKYISGDPWPFDIVGELVDVLPAMEIKRWSLICNEDYKHWKRGEFRFADNSVQEIEKVLNVYVEKEERGYWEIVELTGTLAARKV